MVKDEEARPWTDAPEPFDAAPARRSSTSERRSQTPGLEGVVLRYGWFYGPGTYYASDGSIAEQVRRRRFPIVGRGDGRSFSFIHIDDAASATVAALGARGARDLQRGRRRARAVARVAAGLRRGARAPGVPSGSPTFIARLVAGPFAVAFATQLRGASNAKAKRELGWQPRYPSWRQGFREALG